METHSMIFVTIGNLVSPRSSLLPGQLRGGLGPPPANGNTRPVVSTEAGMPTSVREMWITCRLLRR